MSIPALRIQCESNSYKFHAERSFLFHSFYICLNPLQHCQGWAVLSLAYMHHTIHITLLFSQFGIFPADAVGNDALNSTLWCAWAMSCRLLSRDTRAYFKLCTAHSVLRTLDRMKWACCVGLYIHPSFKPNAKLPCKTAKYKRVPITPWGWQTSQFLQPGICNNFLFYFCSFTIKGSTE